MVLDSERKAFYTMHLERACNCDGRCERGDLRFSHPPPLSRSEHFLPISTKFEILGNKMSVYKKISID